MARSLWKLPFVDTSIVRFIKKNKDQKIKKPIKIWSRRSIILPFFVDKNVEIYNGKTFVKLLVKKSMVGWKFGDFIFTRKKNRNFEIFNLKKKKKK